MIDKLGRACIKQDMKWRPPVSPHWACRPTCTGTSRSWARHLRTCSGSPSCFLSLSRSAPLHSRVATTTWQCKMLKTAACRCQEASPEESARDALVPKVAQSFPHPPFLCIPRLAVFLSLSLSLSLSVSFLLSFSLSRSLGLQARVACPLVGLEVRPVAPQHLQPQRASSKKGEKQKICSLRGGRRTRNSDKSIGGDMHRKNI